VAQIKKKFEKASGNEEWFQWCKSLLELYETEKQYVVSDDIFKSSFLSIEKWILGHDFEGSDLLLRNLLLDAIFSADKVSGAGIYVPWFLYNSLKKQEVHRKSSLAYLEATLSKTNQTAVKNIFESIWSTAGPLTKIILKPSSSTDTVIRTRSSFRFPLHLDAQFHRMVGYMEFVEQINPVVIMIEGAPETIGEINSLLEWNHTCKRPVILIARSFPEEISATLATNWIKGSLNVLPLIYGDTLDTINLAADMCAITKGELISAHFGDVIACSILDKDKWGTVEKIEWTPSGLSIQKDVDIAKHAASLINKIKISDNDEMIELLQDRILSLSDDALEVWIPRKQTQMLEELDGLLKHYNAFVSSGSVNTPLGEIPKSFIDAAQAASQSLREEILSMGGFLVRVVDEVVA